MGCTSSKTAESHGGNTKDLAYISAFPNGVPKPAPSSTPQNELADLQLHPSRDYDDDSESEPPHSSSDDDLFQEYHDNETNLPSTSKGFGRVSGKGTSFRRTNKLNVGILEGTTFLNSYIVVDTLGRGSFGKVKLCLSIEDDSLYAVKVVDKRLIKQVAKSRHLNKRFGNMKAPTSHGNAAAGPSSTGDHLEDLRREVDIMRALNHPNLVKLYEVIDDKVSGKILMVVEFCEAGTLVSPGQLTPERRMPEAIAQFYFRQMVSGIAYLHENSVIHGDMKPENVLLAGDATVKIADFGQSQFMSGGEDTLRRTLGTPAFLSPEICAGEDYRGRPADVWALGVSLYGFIYGELPFKGDSLMELYEDIAEATVPFPPIVAVSIELQDLLLRTLHKDPEARITAAEMLTHPWVREDDLFTLMPSLFSEEAMMEGIGGSAFGGHLEAAGVSPRGQTSPKVAAGGPNKSVSSDGGGASASTSAHGSRTASDANSLPISIGGGGGGGGAPSPADVAAAVFPSLSSLHPSVPSSNGTGGKGSGKRRGGVGDSNDEDEANTGAFSLGPQRSIIGALQQAHHPNNKLATHPSARFHSLATDSMVRRSLDRIESHDDDAFDDADGDDSGKDRDFDSSSKSVGSDNGKREKNMEGQDTSRPSSSSSSSKSPEKQYRKDRKVDAAAKVDAANDGGSGGAPQHPGGVELSKPSAFSVMAQQAQQIQAELLAKQNNLKNSQDFSSTTAAAPAVPAARAQSGTLETIGEEETDHLDASSATQQLDSMMGMPSDSYEIIDAPVGHMAEPPPLPPITEEIKVEDSNYIQKGGSKHRILLNKLQKTSSIAIPSTQSSSLTEITWTTSSGIQQSSQSLTFGSGGESSLPMASPFDTIDGFLKPAMSFLNCTRSGSSPGGGGGSGGADINKEKEIETAADVIKAATAVASPPTAITIEDDTGCEIQEEDEEEEEEEEEEEISDNPSSSALPSTSPPSRNKIFNLLQRISFRGSGESTAVADAAASEPRQESEPALSTPLPSGGGTSKPPPPQEEESTTPPIQWRMYRPGQRLQFQMASQSRTNTVYYIESGMVELRWEATLAVPLTRVLSTMQHPSHKYGTATGTSTPSGGDGTGGGGSGNSGGNVSRPSNTINDSYFNRIDSVALAANKVTTLQPGSAAGGGNTSIDGPTSGIDRSETMANTLQQAAERAEALMVNATGGSLDNLLLSHRGASQFVGALSMLDPDYFADRWKATAIAQTDLVVIQMTRAGLDEFLAQNPLAQVHLRASMARGQAEITKLEALERIAEAHRRKRYPKQALQQGQRRPSWKLSDIKGAFGVTMAEAAEAAGLGGGAGPMEELSRLPTMKQGRDGDASAQETAGLDVFALVSKLRNENGMASWTDLLDGGGGGNGK